MKPLFAFWIGGWFTWGAIGGAVVTGVGSYLGRPKAPKTAELQPVDLQEEQKKAVAGNLANEGSIEALIARGNAFSADQALGIAEKTMPGFGDLSKSLTSRAQSLADNPYDVPEEVTKNLERIAAEKGISAGTRGEFNDFSLLRDLGVNQLEYGRSNINQAQQITGLLSSIAPKVNPMSPLSFYVTPAQTAQTTANNRNQKQEIAQGANNAEASATNAGNADLWGSLTKLAGLYMGGKGTGGGASLMGAEPLNV